MQQKKCVRVTQLVKEILYKRRPPIAPENIPTDIEISFRQAGIDARFIWHNTFKPPKKRKFDMYKTTQVISEIPSRPSHEVKLDQLILEYPRWLVGGKVTQLTGEISSRLKKQVILDAFALSRIPSPNPKVTQFFLESNARKRNRCILDALWLDSLIFPATQDIEIPEPKPVIKDKHDWESWLEEDITSMGYTFIGVVVGAVSWIAIVKTYGQVQWERDLGDYLAGIYGDFGDVPRYYFVPPAIGSIGTGGSPRWRVSNTLIHYSVPIHIDRWQLPGNVFPDEDVYAIPLQSEAGSLRCKVTDFKNMPPQLFFEIFGGKWYPLALEQFTRGTWGGFVKELLPQIIPISYPVYIVVGRIDFQKEIEGAHTYVRILSSCHILRFNQHFPIGGRGWYYHLLPDGSKELYAYSLGIYFAHGIFGVLSFQSDFSYVTTLSPSEGLAEWGPSVIHWDEATQTATVRIGITNYEDESKGRLVDWSISLWQMNNLLSPHPWRHDWILVR